MSRRAWLAWTLAASTVVLAGVHTWMFLTSETAREASVSWPVITVGAVLMAGLGALIVTRIPGHRIGWLFVIGGVALAASGPLFAAATALRDGTATPPEPLDLLLTWAAVALDLSVPGLVLVLTFLLFPDGRLPSRRWRPLLWATWTTFGLFMLIIAGTVRPADPGSPEIAERSGLATLAYDLVAMTLLVELAAAALSVFVRLRRAHGEKRQQLLWLGSAAMLVVVFLLLVMLVEPLGLDDLVGARIAALPLHLAVVGVPLAAGLAVLRYRLYDIDLFVNRAIVLTVLTVFVAAGYVAVVVTIGALVGSRAEGRFWPSLVATAAVAIAFQPVRRLVLRLADRMVYGPRAAPYEALAEFTAGLERAPSPEELIHLLAEEVGRTLGARRASVGLDLPGEIGLEATWSRSRSDESRDHDETVVALRERGDQLGRISLVTDRPLGADQRRLVEHLAQQAAIALRNARLEAELSARVTELARQTEALEQARRDMLASRDRERARLAGALDRQVIPHLASMPAELSELARQAEESPEGVKGPLEHLVGEVGTAHEELRRLSRGLVTEPSATAL